MKIRHVLLNAIAALTGLATVSHAVISVGPTGTGTNDFSTGPAATEWSQLSVAGAAGDYEGAAGLCALEANIKTKDASTITGVITTNGTVPPATFAGARWNSTGLYLQTPPTGNAYTLLMARLQNDSGGPISALLVRYDFSMDPNLGDGTETIKRHRAFWSITGTPGTWNFIPEFSGAAPGNLSATLNLGSWANGAQLYILWADDNGSNPDGGNIIDNFSAESTTPSAPLAPITITSITPATADPEYCWTLFAGSLSTSSCGADGNAGSAARFSQIYGIDINGANDTLFIADRGCNVIRTSTIPGAVVGTVFNANSIGANALVELNVNKVNGNVYFPAITGTVGIYKLVPGDGYTTATLVMAGAYGNGLAVDSAADTVYASRTGANQIDRIENAGTTPAVTLTIGTGTAGNAAGTLTGCQLNAPMGGAVRGTGASAVLYFMDRVGHAVRRIDIAGDSVTRIAGNGGAGTADGIGTAARFSQPHNCVLSPDGNTLFVCDQDNYTVRKVKNIDTTDGGEVTTIMGVNQNADGTGGATEGCGAAVQNGALGQITIDSTGHIYTGDRDSATGSTAHIMKGAETPGGPVMIIVFNIPAGYPTCSTTTKLLSSATVDAPLNTWVDSGATITSLGGGNFQAKVAPSGDAQFYRVQFSY